MRETSDTDVLNLGTTSPYLHRYVNHLNMMQIASTNETTSRSNIAMVFESRKT